MSQYNIHFTNGTRGNYTLETILLLPDDAKFKTHPDYKLFPSFSSVEELITVLQRGQVYKRALWFIGTDEQLKTDWWDPIRIVHMNQLRHNNLHLVLLPFGIIPIDDRNRLSTHELGLPMDGVECCTIF